MLIGITEMTLKKLFNYGLMATCLLGNTIAMEEANNPFPDWRQRPAELINYINYKYIEVCARDRNWGQFPGNMDNGSDYGIMGIPDSLLIESIVRRQPDQDTWVILDVGAGNGGWSRTVATYLTHIFSKELQEKTKSFHLLSLTGDSKRSPVNPTSLKAYAAENVYTENAYTHHSIQSENQINLTNPGVNVYEWHQFPIEYLAQKLPTFHNHVDAIFSFATFRHLCDPLGTYAQAFSLLNEKGVLATDQNVQATINGQYIELPEILINLRLPSLRCPAGGPGAPEGVLTSKMGIQSQQSHVWSYNNLKATPLPDDSPVTVTSPCHVYFIGDIMAELPALSRLTLEAPFPEIVGRRQIQYDLPYFYNSAGYQNFEELVFPGALKLGEYSLLEGNHRTHNRLDNIESIKKELFGYRGIVPTAFKEEVEGLDLEGWKAFYIKDRQSLVNVIL